MVNISFASRHIGKTYSKESRSGIKVKKHVRVFSERRTYFSKKTYMFLTILFRGIFPWVFIACHDL